MASRILVIEDEPFWREQFQDILVGMGLEVDVAEGAKDAEALLTSGKYALVLLDVALDQPYFNLACQYFCASLHQRYPDLPVVATTGKRLDPPEVFTLSKLGVVDFVYKPTIHLPDFQQCIQNALKKSSPGPPTSHSIHALLIGIAAYRHIRPLVKTTTDARDLYDTLLQNGYSPPNVALLLDEQATKSVISDKLDRLARQARPDDTVVIFFSGHGAQLVGGFWPGEYLCPVEAALDKVKDTFISDEEFTAALRAIRAGRLVVFLDACHAGGVGEPKDPAVQIKTGLSETAYTRFLAQGRVIIASCRPDEVSYELAEMRNGLFTHYLLEGLRGGAARQDGTVWMSNLFGYVYERVSQHNLQHPFQKSAAEDFIIAVTKQPQPGTQPPAMPQAPTVPPTGQFDPASVDQTRLRKAMHGVYDRPAFEILCKDLGLDYHDLRGETLETKMLYLIDHFQRHRQYETLVCKVLSDHPHLKAELCDRTRRRGPHCFGRQTDR